MKLDPDEETTHARFRALREAWRNVQTDLATRVRLRAASQEDERTTPPADRVMTSTLRDLLNIVVRLLRRLGGPKDE